MSVPDSGPSYILKSKRGKEKNQKNKKQQQKAFEDKCQWLTPVILATSEAEIRRIVVQRQLGQLFLKILSLKKNRMKQSW
jgi:hypothetical protein